MCSVCKQDYVWETNPKGRYFFTKENLLTYNVLISLISFTANFLFLSQWAEIRRLLASSN